MRSKDVDFVKEMISSPKNSIFFSSIGSVVLYLWVDIKN